MNEQELIWSAVVAWMGAKGIEVAKRVSWLPIDTTTETANRWVARLVALASTIGGDASFDVGAGTLMITGLTTSGIFQAIGEYAKQYALQEVAYKKFVRPESERKNGSP